MLIHALEGSPTPATRCRLAADHLKNSLDTELVASFAIDDLLDYRSRRPMMTFKVDHFTDYDDPQLNLYALRDSLGTPVSAAGRHGPDLQWNGLSPRCDCWPSGSGTPDRRPRRDPDGGSAHPSGHDDAPRTTVS